MSKPAQTPKYTPGKRPSMRCEDCGTWTMSLEQHSCGEEEEFDGTCPLCGTDYGSYLDHMQQCDPE